MKSLTPEAEDLMIQLRDDYFQRLAAEHGIDSAFDYIQQSGAVNNLENEEEVLMYLDESELRLDAFFQITPMLDQEIVYASLNPGTPDTLKKRYFESGHYHTQHQTDGDVEELATQVAIHLDGYLTDNRGPSRIITTLQDTIAILPSTDEVPYEEYVDVESRNDISSSYFSDVYHTRFFKLSSPEGEFVSQFDKKHWRKQFANELQTVDPTLVVAGCRDVWLSIYDCLVDDPSKEIIEHRGSTATRNYSHMNDQSAVGGVFEVPEEDLWVVTIYHESYPHFVDFEQLKENLNYVNTHAFN